jgi:hypothetical protein
MTQPLIQIEETAETVAINAREAALLSPELVAFAHSLVGKAARADYAELIDQVAAGAVSGPALKRLETFLDLGLQTGRFRSRLGPISEDALRRLFDRTPRGGALVDSAAEVTRALAALNGHRIAGLNLALTGPGRYRLVLETDRCRISLGLAPGGAHVESLELDI